MGQFVKKENLTISIGEYEKDGQMKKQWRTIGEIVTMIGDDGQQYQFFKLWGASGVVEGKVFEQDNNQSQAPQQQGYQQPQQNYAPPQHPSAPPKNQPMGSHQQYGGQQSPGYGQQGG